MVYKKYEGASYDTYTVKTNKFKQCSIGVLLRNNIEDPLTLAKLRMLCGIMVYGNKTYNNNRQMNIRSEELYSATTSAGFSKLGGTYELGFYIDFINPAYIKEDNYLDEVIKHFFDIILNPNIENDEFDIKSFNIKKEQIIDEIKRVKENPTKVALRDALKNMDDKSLTSKYITEEDVNKITPSSLYRAYKDFFENSICEVYVIGNLDMDDVVSKIKKEFVYKSIKKVDLNLYISNNKVKKLRKFEKQGDFVQANLIYGFNIDKLEPKQKVAFNVFAEILCGGLTSKLYQKLREKNSLCYAINIIPFKFDRLMLINMSFDSENYKKSVKLIEEAMKEMKTKNITEEEFENAKKSLMVSLKMSNDSLDKIINNYVIHNLDNVPLLEDYERQLSEVTIDDVVLVAKKITPNFIYLLKEEGK